MDHFNMSQSNLNNNSTEFISTAGLFLNLIVVLPENIYVIWLIVTGAGNGVASEFFSLNLSVCEILLCLQCFLSLLGSTSLSLVLAFLNGIPATGRPLFQCLICVERYLAVVHPVTFLKCKPFRYRVICCAVAWIVVVIDCVLIMLGLMNMFEFMCYALCQAMLTLSIKLFCCLAVLRTLKQSGPGEKGQEPVRENNMKRRAFKNIFLIMMAIIFIYAAYVVAAIVYIQTNRFVQILWTAGQVCFWLGGLVQPLLYLHRIKKLPICKSS